jgi:hypothetical protein
MHHNRLQVHQQLVMMWRCCRWRNRQPALLMLGLLLMLVLLVWLLQ